MREWQEFKADEHFGLVENKGLELKLFSGKTVSNYKIVGGSVLDIEDNLIPRSEIGWFRAKKDWNRYKALQKHNETLTEYNFEKLDEFEFAIYDVYTDQDDRDKITKLFEKLKKHIDYAQSIIYTESKNYL